MRENVGRTGCCCCSKEAVGGRGDISTVESQYSSGSGAKEAVDGGGDIAAVASGGPLEKRRGRWRPCRRARGKGRG